MDKKLVIAAAKRAAYTMAQTALGMIVVGSTISDINWLNILSVCAVAGIASILKSVVVGMPEVAKEIQEEG